MSKALGMRCVWGLCGVLASVLLVASAARAEVTTDLSGSIVVWPRVVWTGDDDDGDRDTVIQLTNTSNQLVHAWCFYIDASPINPNFPPGPQNPRRWQVTDFRVWLTRQQPTHWVASQGRFINPNDGFGNDGSGLDPGAIPPVPPGFEGELKCVQTDTEGNAPMGGNALKGEAVIRSGESDVAKYNAISILANPDLFGGDPANELRLGNTPSNNDPESAEFNSCPNVLLLDHFLDGATNPVISTLNPDQCIDECDDPGAPGPGGGAGTCTISEIACSDLTPIEDTECLGAVFCPIRTELTLVPCSQDLENLVPERVTVQFEIINELEQLFSASTTVECYLTTRLADITSPSGTCTIDGSSCQSDAQCLDRGDGFCEKTSVFGLGSVGTSTAFSRILPVDLDGGVIGIATELHYTAEAVTDDDPDENAWASFGLLQESTRFDATVDLEGGPVIDEVILPGGF